MSEAAADKFKDAEPWRRFVDGRSFDVPDEERDRILARMGYSSVEEFLAADKERRSRKNPWREAKDNELAEKVRIEKSEQPLEDWADEFLSKNVIKADLHLFVQALMNIKHWIFNTLSPAQSENLYTALVERMTADKWSLKDLTKTIQEAEPSLDDSQAEAIARSESTLIVNKSREMQFTRDPPGKYGYYWSGPADHRTTEVCAAIKARTPAAGFDSPEDLSRVIKEEAQKYYDSKGYKTQVREWLPHPNCRHTIISKMR